MKRFKEGIPCEVDDQTGRSAPLGIDSSLLTRVTPTAEVMIAEEWNVNARALEGMQESLGETGPLPAIPGRKWSDGIKPAKRNLGSRIARRRKSEGALRLTLWEKAQLLDLASDAILIRDGKDRIRFWNSGAEATYGWAKDEALGRISHDLLQTRLPKPLGAITQELLRESRWEGELVHVKRDGSQIVVASRWALLRDAEGKVRATLEINFDITGRKRLEKQLEEKTHRLQEVNTALKVLLKHRHEDKREFEEALLTSIENMIFPYLRRLKNSPLSGAQAALLEVMESHLSQLTSSFCQTLALQYRVLTPTEMRVAALVREGKTSKEIADLLCISEKTASFHRNNIRTKLGLRRGGANLRSHLLSLA